jgi:hypothetical protein
VEATPAAIPPSIFLWRIPADHVLCFSCFSVASFREPRENGRHPTLEMQKSMGGMV